MTTTATHMSERHQGPLIVIVDDQVTGRKILEQIVRGTCADADVVSFGDPYEALSRIRSDAPDLILTDYKMPTMDGITLIRMVRGIPHCADVPIMVVTIIDERKIRCEEIELAAPMHDIGKIGISSMRWYSSSLHLPNRSSRSWWRRVCRATLMSPKRSFNTSSSG